MSTRAIRTSTEQTICDVCGRTLLRGERADVYIGGGDRHSVCPLCTARALHGGWVREGTMPDYEAAGSRVDRRRGLFGRRRRREIESADPYAPDENPFGDEFFGDGEPEPLALAPTDPAPGAAAADLADPAAADAEPGDRPDPAPAPDWLESPPRGEQSRSRRRRNDSGDRERPATPRRESALSRLGREPRHIRAVPTSIEHKIASAVSLFNDSEHPRTVAGIARSLGLPDVAVHPRDPVGSAVDIVISWELCWYRYEVDLSDEIPAVRAAGQGYELDELTPLERQLNATADDRGLLTI